mgnify:CR=1 FL=1
MAETSHMDSQERIIKLGGRNSETTTKRRLFLMSWTDETNGNLQQQESQSLETLTLENTNLKLKLEEAKSIMSDQSSIINALKNKQMSLVELEEMQETLKVKEQKLSQKDQLYEELKKKFIAEPDILVELKTDFYQMTSPAFDIINNTSKSLTGGVKNLKYDDLRKVLDIVIQARDESKRTQEMCKSLFAKNKKLLDGGITGFELKMHDAKLQEECEIKFRKRYGID